LAQTTISPDEDLIASLLTLLPKVPEAHINSSPTYQYLAKVSKYSIDNLFGPSSPQKANLGNLGEVVLPYYSMGSINSTHLFGLDELILFSFYYTNRNRYTKVADLGANIGLHTIILSKLGYEVTSYEPDGIHFSKIKSNLELNNVSKNPELKNKAISTGSGTVEFTRVKGNTTGSHISGAKENTYGELDKFTVETDSFNEIISEFDLLKIDVEGYEANIILQTDNSSWMNTDAVIEVGNSKNSKLIFDHMKGINVNLFSQKTGWKKVLELEQMPTSYKEGSLFISTKDNIPW
tara:strand:- start:2717 stop:3595 length:879 start_codon:yes stop_codon:yes gene_type:complete